MYSLINHNDFLNKLKEVNPEAYKNIEFLNEYINCKTKIKYNKLKYNNYIIELL